MDTDTERHRADAVRQQHELARQASERARITAGNHECVQKSNVVLS